jgi:hypothetical protein
MKRREKEEMRGREEEERRKRRAEKKVRKEGLKDLWYSSVLIAWNQSTSGYG